MQNDNQVTVISPTLEERKELIQDVIDRVLYLSDKEKEDYLYYIKLANEAYPLNCLKKEGDLRIINPINQFQ